ncbi:MAG TPA: hypothetical protein VGK87_01585, partial [Anaerolineae bacterium]
MNRPVDSVKHAVQFMARRVQSLFAAVAHWLAAVNQRSAEPPPVDLSSAETMDSDTAPAHWLEKTRGDGPPQHWLDDVRSRTVDPDKTVAIEATIEPPDERFVDQRPEIRDSRLETKSDDSVRSIPRTAPKAVEAHLALHLPGVRRNAATSDHAIRRQRVIPKSKQKAPEHRAVKSQTTAEDSTRIHGDTVGTPQVESNPAPNRRIFAGKPVQFPFRTRHPEQPHPQVNAPTEARRTLSANPDEKPARAVRYPISTRRQARATSTNARNSTRLPQTDTPVTARYPVRAVPLIQTESINKNATQAPPYVESRNRRFSSVKPTPTPTSTPKIQPTQNALSHTSDRTIISKPYPNLGAVT